MGLFTKGCLRFTLLPLWSCSSQSWSGGGCPLKAAGEGACGCPRPAASPSFLLGFLSPHCPSVAHEEDLGISLDFLLFCLPLSRGPSRQLPLLPTGTTPCWLMLLRSLQHQALDDTSFPPTIPSTSSMQLFPGSTCSCLGLPSPLSPCLFASCAQKGWVGSAFIGLLSKISARHISVCHPSICVNCWS